jgi:hypothetical protein
MSRPVRKLCRRLAVAALAAAGSLPRNLESSEYVRQGRRRCSGGML